MSDTVENVDWFDGRTAGYGFLSEQGEALVVGYRAPEDATPSLILRQAGAEGEHETMVLAEFADERAAAIALDVLHDLMGPHTVSESVAPAGTSPRDLAEELAECDGGDGALTDVYMMAAGYVSNSRWLKAQIAQALEAEKLQWLQTLASL